jgi:DNA polymerase III epsilon subunit-like protein
MEPRRARQLLWSDLRLIVVDVETLVQEPAMDDDVEQETSAAIDQVRTTGQPVSLQPRPFDARRRQHRAIELAGLRSESSGEDPDRAVSILPASDEPEKPPRPVAGDHRAISVAIVSCRKGKVEGQPWQTLINPGVPVDVTTSAIHGLTDELLAGAPTFSTVAPELLARLTPDSGETTLLVAHNAGFDTGVLRSELDRINLALPELPILDTAGRLAGLAGVNPADRSLTSLLAALQVVNPAPHTAAGDVAATAEAACRLLDKAAETGRHDIIELLDELGARTTTTIVATKPLAVSPRSAEPIIPDDHLAEHFPLPARPGQRQLAGWIRVADDCARYRCAELGHVHTSLVRASAAGPLTVLDALLEVVRRRSADGDGPGAHTALGAAMTAITMWCPVPAPPDHAGGYPINRKQAIRFYHHAMALVEELPRCGTDACPACRESLGCPRDVLCRAVAIPLLSWRWSKGELSRDSAIMNWFPTSRTGGWFYHRRDPGMPIAQSTLNMAGPPAGQTLADAGMAQMLRTYARYGDESVRAQRATEMTARAIDAGCRDPVVWELWARVEATAGQAPDLEMAIRACETGLSFRPAVTTDPAWASLALMRDQLRSQLARGRDLTKIDASGRVVTVRRHTPGDKARRKRPPRFVRT